MAFYNQNPEENFEGNSSKFNEAFLKMRRIHQLQELVNLSSMNLLAYNNELAIWNFEAKFNGCTSLLMECWGKLTPKERKKAKKKKFIIEEFMEQHPIYQEKNNQAQHKTGLKVDLPAWKILKKLLFQYDYFVRKLLSRTGYDSPNKDEFDDDDF